MLHESTQVAFSNLFGSVSLACWIVLLLPQLIEQWRTKSADGIAIGFLIIWAMGDLANLLGAVWAELLPEVILLAVWYVMADALIFSSYFYYKRKSKLIKQRQHNRQSGSNSNDQDEDPTQPLLNRRNSASLPEPDQSDLKEQPQGSIWVRFVFPLLFVFGAGVCGYLFSAKDNKVEIPDQPESPDIGPQLFGYTSALLYLGARIPQIIQNHKRRSVFGLSLLFFILSTLANLTYAGSILMYRQDKAWITLNFSWLLGSLGTIFEDVIIFAQFYIYQGHKKNDDDDDSTAVSD